MLRLISTFRRRTRLMLVMAALASPIAAQAQPGSAQLGLVTGFFGQLMSGDMGAIQLLSFGISGFVAVLGFWLLISGRKVPAAVEDGHSDGIANERQRSARPVEPEPQPVTKPLFQPGAPRPLRLLEAIAAAKEQFAISEGEHQARLADLARQRRRQEPPTV